MNECGVDICNSYDNNNKSSLYDHQHDVTPVENGTGTDRFLRFPASSDRYPDMIVPVQNGVGEECVPPGGVPEDLYTQLAERERDLQLAAELGNALLEQNEELKKNHEHVVEEYNAKIEALNEEKHKLRLQERSLEAEYELTIKELQSDICGLRQELDGERSQSRAGNKSQSQIVEQLMLQNDRLTQQLKQAATTEEHLQSQLETLRHQVAARKTSIHEHVHQLQMLRDEITLLTERKSEVERRLVVVSEERDVLANQMEEFQDRIMMLERQQVEQQYTMRQQTKELSELRDQNESLTHHVNTSMSSSDADTSLLAELEMSDQTTTSHGPDRVGNDQLKQEILEVYSQLQRLVLELKGCGEDWKPSESPTKNGLKAGSLLAVLRELRELTEDIVKKQRLQKCELSERDLDVLEIQVASLKKELAASQGQIDRMKVELGDKDEQLQKRNHELSELAKQICSHQEHEQRLLAERDSLQDVAAGVTSKDDIIHQARTDRDLAIQKSQELEVELVQVRNDMLCMDSQLINTIKHKLNLSQQLEQWQCDMEDLVSVQVNTLLSQEETKKPASKSPTPAASPAKQKPKLKFWR